MSWLSSDIIRQKVQRNADEATWKAFDDVYSVDTLPSVIHHYPIFIVLNTDTKNLPGEHWKVIFIKEDKRGELFDSLASPPTIATQQWLKKHTRQWKTNACTIQHPQSSKCGAFVLYFILKRLHVRRFECLTKNFSANLHVNEKMITQFYNDLK